MNENEQFIELADGNPVKNARAVLLPILTLDRKITGYHPLASQENERICGHTVPLDRGNIIHIVCSFQC